MQILNAARCRLEKTLYYWHIFLVHSFSSDVHGKVLVKFYGAKEWDS